MSPIPAIEDLAALAVLDDPVRHRLFALVRAAAEPVTREEAAREVGISRKLAAFHLDRLVGSGLIEVVAPEAGRRRPGRPAKRYRAAVVELSVSVPERRYDLIGAILLDAIIGAEHGEDLRDAALEAGGSRGRELGRQLAESRRLGRVGPERALSGAVELLSELGYEPVRLLGSKVVLRNCPFHRLADRSPELICAVNRDFVEGLLRGLGTDRVVSRLVEPEGGCCVALEIPE